MFAYLFLLFTFTSLIELSILVWIGGQSAWWVPIVIVIVTGFAGAALARWQGWLVLERIQNDLRQGRVPADALLDGLFILAAGLLLIAPGVLTDATGIALLLPPARRAVKRQAIHWLRRNMEARAAVFYSEYGSGASFSGRPSSTSSRAEIIDARVIESRVEDAD
jgi:UPF0716 protein FxsA